MARKTPGDSGRPGRFAKSGHTSHRPRMPYYPPPPPPTAQPPPPPPAIRPPYPAAAPPPDGFPQPSYHDTRPSEQPARGVVARGNQLAKNVTRKVIDASKADGADESGLTALIWNQVLSYGTDAMITVALAGTVFFAASPMRNVATCCSICSSPWPRSRSSRLSSDRPWTACSTDVVTPWPPPRSDVRCSRSSWRPPDGSPRAVSLRPGLAGALQGLQRHPCGGGASPGTCGHDPGRGQRPAVYFRPWLGVDRRWRGGRRHQGQWVVHRRPGSHRRCVRGLRLLRVPAAQAHRLGRACSARSARASAPGRHAADAASCAAPAAAGVGQAGFRGAGGHLVARRVHPAVSVRPADDLPGLLRRVHVARLDGGLRARRGRRGSGAGNFAGTASAPGSNSPTPRR